MVMRGILGILVISICLFGCIQINAMEQQPHANNQTSQNTTQIANELPLVLTYSDPSCGENFVRYTLTIKDQQNNPVDASVDLFTGESRIYSGYAQSGVFDVCLNRRINAIVSPVAQKQGYTRNSNGSNSVTIDQNSYNLYIENMYLFQN